MPGRLSGSVTSTKARSRLAPRLRAASSSRPSMRPMTPVSVSTMNGT
jgi:hypothetical protein